MNGKLLVRTIFLNMRHEVLVRLVLYRMISSITDIIITQSSCKGVVLDDDVTDQLCCLNIGSLAKGLIVKSHTRTISLSLLLSGPRVCKLGEEGNATRNHHTITTYKKANEMRAWCERSGCGSIGICLFLSLTN